MGFFNKRSVIKRGEISDTKRLADFILWFLKNEKLVTTLSEPSNNIIFNEGYRPFFIEGHNPEEKTKLITDLKTWFLTKMFISLNLLKDAPKDEWRDFIEKLDKQGEKTLIVSGEIAIKYNLDTEHFIYQKEISKITDEKDLNAFKDNFLKDNVLGAEMRILAWLYQNYFGEPLQIL